MLIARRAILIVTFYYLVAVCGTSVDNQRDAEGRGKKKKIALAIYFADLVVKKVFILKLIYAFVFWVIIHKAGYFLSWFVSYLKEKKHDDHYIEHHGHYHVPHHHYDHGYGYGPYRRKTQ